MSQQITACQRGPGPPCLQLGNRDCSLGRFEGPKEHQRLYTVIIYSNKSKKYGELVYSSHPRGKRTLPAVDFSTLERKAPSRDEGNVGLCPATAGDIRVTAGQRSQNSAAIWFLYILREPRNKHLKILSMVSAERAASEGRTETPRTAALRRRSYGQAERADDAVHGLVLPSHGAAPWGKQSGTGDQDGGWDVPTSYKSQTQAPPFPGTQRRLASLSQLF